MSFLLIHSDIPFSPFYPPGPPSLGHGKAASMPMTSQRMPALTGPGCPRTGPSRKEGQDPRSSKAGLWRLSGEVSPEQRGASASPSPRHRSHQAASSSPWVRSKAGPPWVPRGGLLITAVGQAGILARLNFLKDTKSDLWGFFWFSCLTDHSPESNLFFPLLEYY